MTNGRHGGSKYWKFHPVEVYDFKTSDPNSFGHRTRFTRTSHAPDSQQTELEDSLKLITRFKSAQRYFFDSTSHFSSVINRISDNIYVGYGHKYSLSSYSPLALPEIACEYPPGQELADGDDPTVEQEAEALAARRTNEDEGEDDADE